MAILVLTSANTAEVLADDIIGYHLTDKGPSDETIVCPKTTNSLGTSIVNTSVNNFGVTDLVNNGQTIATISPLSTYPNSGVSSSAINNHSQVVGTHINRIQPTSVQGEAFIWQDGNLTLIASQRAFASDINNYGYVVGSVVAQKGFVWRDGNSIDLPGLNSTYIFPRCINDEGIITGDTFQIHHIGNDNIFENHKVVWTPYDNTGNYNNGFNNYSNSNYNNGYNSNAIIESNNGYIEPYEIVSNGYNNGYNNGFNNGYNNYYNNGYNNNYNNGYNNGYIQE